MGTSFGETVVESLRPRCLGVFSGSVILPSCDPAGWCSVRCHGCDSLHVSKRLYFVTLTKRKFDFFFFFNFFLPV